MKYRLLTEVGLVARLINAMETNTEVNNVFLPYHTVTKQQNLVKNKIRNKGLVE